MSDFTFDALGTKWCVSTDSAGLPEEAKRKVLEHVAEFERRFSRFLASSEVNAFKSVAAGKFPISKEFAILLAMAKRLRSLTGGVYDPAVGSLLEEAGYDSKYKMVPGDAVDKFVLPKWTIEGETLTLDGPAVFDLGGIGKGYCIDKVSTLLKELGYAHFLVDGGGDMFATSKSDGSAWRVAIQYPGKPDVAAGIIELKDGGIAVSDSFRRRWGKWHHLVHPQLKKSIKNVTGAVAVAPSAWHADCMTSALFFAPHNALPKAAREYRAKYLLFKQDGTCAISSNWTGELF
jgi:thiamine biosynthesis lipoprotein